MEKDILINRTPLMNEFNKPKLLKKDPEKYWSDYMVWLEEQLHIQRVSQQCELLIDLVEQIKLTSYAVPMKEEKYNELIEKIKSINCG